MRLDCIDVIEAPGEPVCFFCNCGREGFPEVGWQLGPETDDDRQLMVKVLGTADPIMICYDCAEAYNAPAYGPEDWLADMLGLREMLPDGASFGPVPPAQPPRGFWGPTLVAPGADAGGKKA